MKELLFLLVAKQPWEGSNLRSAHLVARGDGDILYVWSGSNDVNGSGYSFQGRSEVLKESHSRSGTTNLTTEDALFYISMGAGAVGEATVAVLSLHGISMTEATSSLPVDYEFVSKGILSNKLIKK